MNVDMGPLERYSGCFRVPWVPLPSLTGVLMRERRGHREHGVRTPQREASGGCRQHSGLGPLASGAGRREVCGFSHPVCSV